MKKFRSIVRKSGGDKYIEEFEALDENDAINKLQLRNLTIVSLEEIGDSEFKESKLETNFIKNNKKIILLFIIIFSVLGIFAYSSFLVKREKAQKVAAEKAQKETEEKAQEDILALQEKDLFEKTKAENKIESYREFLNRYPKGKFAEQAQELLNKRYKEGVEVCANFIIVHAEESIKICNVYSRVWQEAIESNFLDFNTQLLLIHNKLESQGTYRELEEVKSKLTEFMKKFIEPPSKYVDVHKKIVELYGIYSQIYSLAVAPTGSLLSFNNSVSQLQSNLIKAKNELDVMLKD